jgi:predicted oxidoreductase
MAPVLAPRAPPPSHATDETRAAPDLITRRRALLGGTAIPGQDAAGEVSGFGGGGVHGRRSQEGACIFSGRQAGRAAAAVR